MKRLLFPLFSLLILFSCRESDVDIPENELDLDGSIIWHYGDTELLDSIVEYSNGRCTLRVIRTYDEYGRPLEWTKYFYDEIDHYYKSEWSYSEGGREITVLQSEKKNGEWEAMYMDLITLVSERDSCTERYIWKNGDWLLYVQVEHRLDKNGRTVFESSFFPDSREGRKREKAYDENGYCILEKFYSWYNGDWSQMYQYDCNYDDMGNCLYRKTQRSYSYGKMQNDSLVERTYDREGRETGYSSKVWREDAWIGVRKYSLVYDDYGNVAENCIYMWNESQVDWIPEIRTSRSYDSEGRLVSDASYYWSDGAWVGSGYMKEYCYDSNGNLLFDARYLWNTANACWILNDKKSDQFDSDGRLIHSVSETTTQRIDITWDDGKIVRTTYILSGTGAECEMIPSQKKVTILNQEGRDSVIISSNWNEGQWVDYSRIFLSYDDISGNIVGNMDYVMADGEWMLISGKKYEIEREGLKETRQQYIWDSYYKRWEEYSLKSIITYDESGRIMEELKLHAVWDDRLNPPHWENEKIIEYTYDSYGNNTGFIDSDWDPFKNEWSPREKEEYAFDVDGNMIFKAGYMYDRSSERWIGGEKWTAEYDDSGNKILEMLYNWIELLADWQPGMKTVYAYDNDGNLMDKIRYDWANRNNTWDWLSVSRTLFSFDPETKTTHEYNLEYNYSVHGWTGSRSVKETDDYGNVVLEIKYVWKDERWMVLNQIERTFDAKGNVLSYSTYKEDEEGLILIQNTEYTYDSKNRLVSTVQKDNKGVIIFMRSIYYSLYSKIKIIDGFI